MYITLVINNMPEIYPYNCIKYTMYHTICETKKCKYYSVSSDSTPGILRVDQRTNCALFPAIQTGGKICTVLGYGRLYWCITRPRFTRYLNENNIENEECHGQSCNNPSNIKEKYLSLQARINEIHTYARIYSHTVNLVVKRAGEW